MRGLMLLVGVILLFACQPSPEPMSPPEQQYTFQLPALAGFPKTLSDKAGMAYSGWGDGLPWPKGILGYKEDAVWHAWAGFDNDYSPSDPCGGMIMMIWSWEGAANSQGYQYLAKAVEQMRQIEIDNNMPPYSYDGCVMWANEFNRPDQADMTALEVAQFFFAILGECPECKLIGPSTASDDDGRKVREVIETIIEMCGLPCPELGNIYAYNPHHFNIPVLWDINKRIEEFCDWLFGPVYFDANGVLTRVNNGYPDPCELPIWPTVGWTSNNPENVATVFPTWLGQLDNHPDVEKYFIFAPWQEQGTGFEPFMDMDALPSYVFTDYGNALRSYIGYVPSNFDGYSGYPAPQSSFGYP